MMMKRTLLRNHSSSRRLNTILCNNSNIINNKRIPKRPITTSGIQIHEQGDRDVLNYRETIKLPSLKKGEILVKNEYIGVNFIDTYHRGGLYPVSLPFIPGVEGAGVVVAVGDHDGCIDDDDGCIEDDNNTKHQFKIGEKVAYFVGPLGGGYARETIVPVKDAVSLENKKITTK